MLFINKARDQSDIIMIDVVEHFGGAKENLDVYFHCCGCIYDLIPDFIDIGVNLIGDTERVLP